MLQIQLDDRIYSYWDFCTLHPMFQAHFSNLWLGIFFTDVIYLYTFCMVSTFVGEAPVSNSKTGLDIDTIFSSPFLDIDVMSRVLMFIFYELEQFQTVFAFFI